MRSCGDGGGVVVRVLVLGAMVVRVPVLGPVLGGVFMMRVSVSRRGLRFRCFFKHCNKLFSEDDGKAISQSCSADLKDGLLLLYLPSLLWKVKASFLLTPAVSMKPYSW